MTTLAVDLGGTRMRVAAVADDGEVMGRAIRPTPQDEPCAEALIALVEALPAGRGAARAVIGVPGRVDYSEGVLEHAPNPAAGVGVVVIGGGLGLHAPGLAGAASAEVDARGPRQLPVPITVRTAELGDDAGLAGADAWVSAAG